MIPKPLKAIESSRKAAEARIKPILKNKAVDIISEITIALAIDPNVFSRLLRESMQLLQLKDEDVAQAIAVGRSSVQRWRTGKSTPSNAMREIALKWLQWQLERQVN